MLTPQFLLPLADELIVDNFAGGGGASTGIERAIGRPIDIAINHDPEAVAMHAANHPQTLHLCESVWDVNPRDLCAGRPVGLAWFSPDCKHFSKAKGGKPVEKRIRGLAWVAVRWAATVKPRIICLENVEEFVTWGPLTQDGRPCPRTKGREFRAFVNALGRLGYVVEWRELRACDFGAPTSRKRLFLIARSDGQPIVWPAPTHAAPSSRLRENGLKPWRTAAECIDWSIPCPSIFTRERPLAEATMRRIARGIKRYVLDAAEPYIVRIGHTGHGDAAKVCGLNEPLTTITSKAEHLLVAPTLIQTGYGERPGQAPRVPGLDKPLGTVVNGQKHALVAAFLARHYGGMVGSSLTDPLHTVTATDHHSLVEARLEVTDAGNSGGHGADSHRHPRGQGRRHDLEDRRPVEHRGDQAKATGQSRQTDGPRVSGLAHELCSEAVHGSCSSRSVDALERPNSDRDGHQSSRREQAQQLSRQPGARDTQREPSSRLPNGNSSFAKELQGANFGNDRRPGESAPSEGNELQQDCDDARRFADDGLPGHASEVRAFLLKFYSSGGQLAGLDEPMHTLPTKDRMGLVTVHGQDYVIADIGMRMLQPRELARAQGFGDSYLLEAPHLGRPLPKHAQVRMIGNSVCPPMAEALVRANYRERQALREAA